MLSPEQEKFCLEYQGNKNGADAFRKSHSIKNITDTQSAARALELLANTEITSRIAALSELLSEDTILTKEQVLAELTRIARTAPFHSDRNKALDLLGRYHKLFQPEEKTKNINIRDERKLQIVYMVDGKITTQSPLRKALTPPVTAPAPVTSAPVDAPVFSAEEETDILDDLS